MLINMCWVQSCDHFISIWIYSWSAEEWRVLTLSQNGMRSLVSCAILAQGWSIIVGNIQRSHRWPCQWAGSPSMNCPTGPGSSWARWFAMSKNARSRRKLKRSEQPQWRILRQRSQRAQCSPETRSAHLWALISGFPHRGSKWSEITKFVVSKKPTVNGVNMATTITEKIELPSTDVNVAALRWLRSHINKDEKIEGRVLDERRAFRQIRVRPDHRRWSVISLREPSTGRSPSLSW